jgi:hypothetical protein
MTRPKVRPLSPECAQGLLHGQGQGHAKSKVCSAWVLCRAPTAHFSTSRRKALDKNNTKKKRREQREKAREKKERNRKEKEREKEKEGERREETREKTEKKKRSCSTLWASKHGLDKHAKVDRGFELEVMGTFGTTFRQKVFPASFLTRISHTL